MGGEGSKAEEAKHEDKINWKLDSWKEYVAREDGIHKCSGLARGPKLPFDWQKASLEQSRQTSSVAMDNKSQLEICKQINCMSIEVLKAFLKQVMHTEG